MANQALNSIVEKLTCSLHMTIAHCACALTSPTKKYLVLLDPYPCMEVLLLVPDLWATSRRKIDAFIFF